MELKNIFKMTKTDRYTQDGRDELAKLQETEDVRYKTGDISQKTGLQKQPDGSWAPPKKGTRAGAGKPEAAEGWTETRMASGKLYDLKSQGKRIIEQYDPETETKTFKLRDLNNSRAPDKEFKTLEEAKAAAAKKEAGSINRTPERIAKETAIMEALNLSSGEDNNLHKMSDETIERLYARTQEKPAAGKTTVRQGPNTKTLDEPPGEHIQKNLDTYRGYKPGDMEGLVLGPSGYKKQSSSKGPDGVSSITYTKEGEEDIVLSFDKYGELKNAGTSQDREGVMKKMQAAEGLGHMKVIGDYDVYRVTSGPDKGKYKVSKVGSLEEVTMSEQKAADFLSSAAGSTENKGAGIPTYKEEDFIGKTYKDFVTAIPRGQFMITRNQDNPDGSSENDFTDVKNGGKKITVKFDKNGKITSVKQHESPTRQYTVRSTDAAPRQLTGDTKIRIKK